MAQDSEKRFRSIMDKLFHSSKSPSNTYRFLLSIHYHSSHYHMDYYLLLICCVCSSSSGGVQLSNSRGKKRPYQSIVSVSGVVMDWRGDDQSSSSAAAPELQPHHLCRPWDRADFMTRLATFKSISWFAKPKVCSANQFLFISLLYTCISLWFKLQGREGNRVELRACFNLWKQLMRCL